MKEQERGSFTSKFGVIAAAAGSAVGLGNIWRFPYVAGENGGGAFLLIYLFFILAIGIPVMLSEFTIGRKAQRNAFGSFRKLAPGSGWPLVGLMGIVAAFVILAFYSTIAGWTLEYIIKSVQDGFRGNDTAELFETFKSGTFKPLLWQFLFMVVTAWIVFAGVQKGIERYTKILMPILVVLILSMCVRAVTLDGAEKGLSFLFKPDFSKITFNVVLEALGQAAFSLSIGMGALITYGSYIRKNNNLSNTAIQVASTDTLIAILAGVMIFPAVFALGLDPKAGPGLVFEVLPKLFMKMPLGYYFSILFFVLLAVAALTSTVSVLEVVVAYFSEELNMSRGKATIISAASIWVFGILATLSFSDLSGVTIFGNTFFDLMDYISANVLLPLGALLIVIFLGWKLGKKVTQQEITNEGALRPKLFSVFFFIVKYIAPVAIVLVFLNSLGILKI
ncbi:sodium-dependent transporter [Salinivirga cyanobacteriivorans]|uniref:Transporter n=1 Tax=Salinivirga cyanobacteriivorans TaxID=1307839 RepID=A0A0S2I330_9BACT|nr:sodium-dependent transporter [Salinivirga cyanobacteriivorans]ALO16656.1 Na+-dependent transporters of the SNF family protein [Salinivirga cyanobacteriivorans]